MILCCFVDSEQARKAVDCQVITQDLLKSGRREVAKKCTDDCVDLNRLQVYFSPDAWLKVQHLIAGVCKLEWLCNSCTKRLADSSYVGCDRCLEWYHLSCVGLSRTPKTKLWLCRMCYHGV